MDPGGVVTALVFLPVLYNPGPAGRREPIEDEKFILTCEELAQRFGGVTLHYHPGGSPRGFWWDRGIVDQDVLAVAELDVAETPENRTELRRYAKEVLLRRFQQRAIYLKWFGPVQTWTVVDETVE